MPICSETEIADESLKLLELSESARAGPCKKRQKIHSIRNIDAYRAMYFLEFIPLLDDCFFILSQKVTGYKPIKYIIYLYYPVNFQVDGQRIIIYKCFVFFFGIDFYNNAFDTNMRIFIINNNSH